MKKWLLALLALASPALAEDYVCGDPVCVARITEEGVLNDVYFRKGDMVSTDAGWDVSTDDGWVKVKVGGKTHPRPLWGDRVWLRIAYLTGFHTVVTNIPTYGPPKAFGSFAVAVPVSISTIGL